MTRILAKGTLLHWAFLNILVYKDFLNILVYKALLNILVYQAFLNILVYKAVFWTYWYIKQLFWTYWYIKAVFGTYWYISSFLNILVYQAVTHFLSFVWRRLLVEECATFYMYDYIANSSLSWRREITNSAK